MMCQVVAITNLYSLISSKTGVSMFAEQTHRQERSNGDQNRGVNDFSITVATVNGSGSQTSNLTILRALFKMGIPVSGKNLFPSNIQGLPTWYTIRVSKDGYLARREGRKLWWR
jgi:hypothetical protein